MPYFGRRHVRYTVAGPFRSIVRLSLAVSILAVQLGMIVIAGAVPRGWFHTRLFSSLTQITGRTFLWFIGVRLRVRGELPPTGSVIVANHIGWIDGFVYAGILGSRFVAIDWIHRIPLVRSALRTLSVESIRRSAMRDLPRLNAILEGIFASDRSILFFPEATTMRGDRIYDFRSALLDNSAKKIRPVYWSVLTYSMPTNWPPAGLVIPWADWTPLIVQAYRVAHVPRITSTVIFGKKPEARSDRRELAGQLQSRIRAAFVPLEQASPEETARFYRKPPKDAEVY